MIRESTFEHAVLLGYLGYKITKLTTSPTEGDDRYFFDVPQSDVEQVEKDLADPESQFITWRS
jgi:hypothetical protein